MILKPGSLYSCVYSNWHHDRYPLLFVLYSDRKKIIGLNVHYIKIDEYNKLTRMFSRVQSDKRLSRKFFNNPRAFYHEWLKPNFKEFIDVSYRMYHQPLIMGVSAHPILLSQIGSRWRERFTLPKTTEFDKIKQRSETDVAVKEIKDLMLQYGKKTSTMSSIRDFLKYIKDSYLDDLARKLR